MGAEIIDGKAIAARMSKELSGRVSEFRSRHGTDPTLAVVMVGDYEPSRVYVRMKEKAAGEAGIRFVRHEFPEIGRGKLLEVVQELNKDRGVHGIIVQLPLPEALSEEEVLTAVSPEKDVDGFNVFNMGSLFRGKENLMPCTPLGVIKLLEESGVPMEGKDVVIVNRSNIVGKPLAMMMLKRSATVTICHSRTKDLGEHTRRADILVSATGAPGMIKPDMVKDGAVVIDVGISRVEGKLLGDVDFEGVKEKASFITPVPGGVGPMTVAMVLHNTLEAARNQMEGRA